MLELQSVTRRFGANRAVDDVSLAIEPGSFVGVIGRSGAGKSTLLKSLFGMTTHKGGSIQWKGKDIAGLRPQTMLAHGIAYVPQGRCNFQLMSIDENLEMAAYTIKDGDLKADREYVYDLFPILRQRRNELAGNLSGGEQQLLEMAMAVLRRPEILLVDEPSVGLSPQAITLVFNELKRLHQGGRTILLVEQNTRKAMQAADRAVVLRLGKVIWDSPVAELSHEKLGELFMTGHHRYEASSG